MSPSVLQLCWNDRVVRFFKTPIWLCINLSVCYCSFYFFKWSRIQIIMCFLKWNCSNLHCVLSWSVICCIWKVWWDSVLNLAIKGKLSKRIHKEQIVSHPKRAIKLLQKHVLWVFFELQRNMICSHISLLFYLYGISLTNVCWVYPKSRR